MLLSLMVALLTGTSAGRVQSVAHDLLRLAHDGVEVGLVLEAFRVDLVNVFRAGGSGREPPAGGYNLQAADRGVVARGVGQLGRDWFAGQFRLTDGCTTACRTQPSVRGSVRSGLCPCVR